MINFLQIIHNYLYNVYFKLRFRMKNDEFLEIFLMVLITQEIYSKVMKNLVEGVLNNNSNIKIKYFIGDGAYTN